MNNNTFDKDFIRMVSEAMERPLADGDVESVLKARCQVISALTRDWEKLRSIYSFRIPEEILFHWLRDIGWATMDDTYGEPSALLSFHPISDPEDSYFQVLDGDGDLKDSLADAVKKGYFRLKGDQKEERRQEYLKLKKEFEP
jgi:hypothetical protein